VLGCGALWPSALGFLYQRFSSLLRNEACPFRNQQSSAWSNVATMVLSRTRGLSFLLVVRQGLGSCGRLGARSRQGVTYQLRLALEPECSENLTASAREIPRDGADSIRDTQAFRGVRYWASKLTPRFHTINTIAAIFRACAEQIIGGGDLLIHLDLFARTDFRLFCSRYELLSCATTPHLQSIVQ
jgi:hypothetical protein